LPPIISGPLWRLALARLPRKTGEEFVTRTLTGSLYAHRTGDLLADRVLMCGYWDWRELVLAAEYCPPGGRIIEIGANTGTETVNFAMIAGRRGSVIAFEPEPSVLRVLRRNVEINGFTHVSVIAAAVSDRNGSVRFVPPSPLGNSGIGWVAQDGAVPTDALEVPAVTLDSLIEDHGAANVIAIDAEGHEVAVLRGARQYLRRYRPMVILEASTSLLARAGQSLASLFAELSEAQYEAYEISRSGVRPVTQKECAAGYEGNWLCAPKERGVDRKRVAQAFLDSWLAPNLWRLHPLHRDFEAGR
jgi:FkbM family methyltransferase